MMPAPVTYTRSPTDRLDRAQVTVALDRWADDNLAVFQVLRDAKLYRIACRIDLPRDRWDIRSIIKSRGKTQERRLKPGPTFDAVARNIVFSRAWHQYVEPLLNK